MEWIKNSVEHVRMWEECWKSNFPKSPEVPEFPETLDHAFRLIIDEVNRKRREWAKARWKNMTPEEKKKKSDQISKIIAKKYKNDPEFRAKKQEYNRKWNRKKKLKERTKN